MNQLRDKKTGQYISMKKIPEVDTKNVIDIWVGGEPEPDTSPDTLLIASASAALIGLTFFLFALGIYVVGKI
jgi:hypothetical protein